jgi:Tetrapyrrole (Corrin/Porphyrin) Methylases
MVDYILSFVRAGQRVCAVFYGHPGVFAFPPHESVRRAREEGFHAEMLAGISADACLYADLGVDPAEGGCQSFEATDFLVRHRRFDPHNQLVLWQVGVIGMLDRNPDFDPRPGLDVLVGRLAEFYPADHSVTVYEASPYAACDPKIVTVGLQDLPSAAVTAISTLYIPPVADLELDDAVLELVGISAEDLSRRRESGRRRMRETSTAARPATMSAHAPAPPI